MVFFCDAPPNKLQSYSLASMVRRRPGSYALVPVIPVPLGLEKSLLSELRKVEQEIARGVRDIIVPRYKQRLTTDADEDAFSALRRLVAAIVRSTGEQVSQLLKLEGLRHTKQWMTTARKAFGIDLSSVVKEEDIGSYLEAAALRNATLITGMADDIVKRVAQETTTALIGGESAAKLQERLKRQLEIGDARARLIARDQTSKLTADLNRIRHEQAGIKKYIWRTSQDERVRLRHRNLEGKVYAYGEPTGAEEGLPPGQPIQCRCVAQAVVEFEAVEMPKRVAADPGEAALPVIQEKLQDNTVPEVNAFWSKLEGIGEQFVQAPDQFYMDPDLKLIHKLGKTFDAKKSLYMAGAEGECHWNASRLFSAGEVDEIVVGYAENEWGWFQHTWGLKDGKVVESSPSSREYPASNYHGVPLGKGRSKQFAEWVLKKENAPGNGNVRTVKGGIKWVSE